MDSKIISQRIGRMFDNIDGHKPDLKTRLDWKWRDINGVYCDMKYLFRNHFIWFKTISRIRPWDGFDGLIDVMITHLLDYIRTEIKYGDSIEESRNKKIATAKETVRLLRQMRNPAFHLNRRFMQVKKRYPKYKRLITKYKSGSTGVSGNFVAQGNGWVGKESGNDPQEGYFEFTNGRFELAESPDQAETDRLLAELRQYNEDIDNAFKQAKIDSDRNFVKLHKLLKENLYSWWD